MILIFKAKHVFKIRLKYFHNNLNIVAILTPSREFPLLNVHNFL